jgi:hypothetical protein
VARLQPGEDIFVSAAAGAVGSAVGRMARLLGAGRVIGSAGSAAKVKHLTEELGFDAAFDYRSGPVSELLAQAAPEGIDVYFDNVGGDHLEAAIGLLREYGRIAWCGAVAQYNSLDAPPAAPRKLCDVVGKSLRLEGCLVANHGDAREELERFVVPHIQSGRVVSDETVVDGFERTVEAFLGMLRGENTGKMLVRPAPWRAPPLRTAARRSRLAVATAGPAPRAGRAWDGSAPSPRRGGRRAARCPRRCPRTGRCPQPPAARRRPPSRGPAPSPGPPVAADPAPARRRRLGR